MWSRPYCEYIDISDEDSEKQRVNHELPYTEYIGFDSEEERVQSVVTPQSINKGRGKRGKDKQPRKRNLSSEMFLPVSMDDPHRRVKLHRQRKKLKSLSTMVNSLIVGNDSPCVRSTALLDSMLPDFAGSQCVGIAYVDSY